MRSPAPFLALLSLVHHLSASRVVGPPVPPSLDGFELPEASRLSLMERKGNDQWLPANANDEADPVGLRVARGEDWQWYKQDEPSGAGTVVQVTAWKNEPAKAWRVMWDHGEWNLYRWGAEEGKFDLKVIESEPRVPREEIRWEEPAVKDQRCRQNQKIALREIFDALGGMEWKMAKGWEMDHGEMQCTEERTDNAGGGMCEMEEKNDPCLLPWTGVVCKDGDVISISLDQNNLAGTIPGEALKQLSALKSLDLSLNNIVGTIPSEIGNLEHLEYLELKHNQLEGSIGSWAGNLKELSWISVTGNRLTGQLPQTLLDSEKLKHLFISNNRFHIDRSQFPPMKDRIIRF